MAQQTAVDFLVKKFHDYGTLYYSDIEEAKAIEKEQIEEAFDSGLAYDYDDSETYYNKAYTNGL
jgi:hypothetical protein